MRKRILIGLGCPVLLALLVYYELLGGTGMSCLFFRLTGLYCPGCGSGRAVQALFRGRYPDIFKYNILLPVLGIPCLAILVHEYLRIVFPGLGWKPVRIPQRILEAVIAVIVLFWILRNIPAFAFLAPAG